MPSEAEQRRVQVQIALWRALMWREAARKFVERIKRQLGREGQLFLASSCFFALISFRLGPLLLCALPASVAALLLLKEDCDICYESVSPISFMYNSCGHRCCASCLRRYLESDQNEVLHRLRRARAFTIRCFGGCDQHLDQSLAFIGTNSERLQKCMLDLAKRQQLIERCPPESQWVECPEMSCVGVGYRGRQRIMCFICEHQWEDPDFGVVRSLWNWVKKTLWPERIDGVSGWRPCPHCGAAIVRNGGCDNMRCTLCDRTFRWGPFANSTTGVVEAHAPPSTRVGGAR